MKEANYKHPFTTRMAFPPTNLPTRAPESEAQSVERRASFKCQSLANTVNHFLVEASGRCRCRGIQGHLFASDVNMCTGNCLGGVPFIQCMKTVWREGTAQRPR